MQRRGTWGSWGVCVGVVAWLGCGDPRRDEGPSFDTDGPVSATAGMSQSATGSSHGTSGGEIKLDVGAGMSASAEGGAQGCQKVDFLFVVDNSGSMEDEQQNLVASFPGFISTIENTLMAGDFHIMVVDTDAESLSFQEITCSNGDCSCMPEPQCCFALCANEGPITFDPPPTECAGQSCDAFELPTGCPVTLGAGKAEDPLGMECGIASDARYMTEDQPDLTGTFACAALVGAGGDGNERAMEAMTEALTSQSQASGCNEGFLRDDAILVVTFISDEDDEASPGDPDDWAQSLVQAKNGQEEAIVVLGLLGDSEVAGGTCTPDRADDAPRLRQFTEHFEKGSWASVCAPSYADFFEAAVAVIDVTCDEFVPAG